MSTTAQHATIPETAEQTRTLAQDHSMLSLECDGCSEKESFLAPPSILYHLQTFYLLSYADVHQFILPTLIFGLVTSLSPALLASPTPIALLDILYKTPIALFWIWAFTIIFDLSNQRQPAAIREDSINKPYRPIPSGRLTAEQMRRLALYGVPLTYVLLSWLGASAETPTMYLLLWMYNDLGGSDEHFLIRNTLNAIGYVACGFGIARVVSGGFGLHEVGYAWGGLLCAVIASTLHIQDLRDQEGDQSVGRKTLPLVVGDGRARWCIVVGMLGWSVACCLFWEVGYFEWSLVMGCAGFVGWRLLCIREKRADAFSYKLWGLWLSSLYILPLCYDWSIRWQVLEAISRGE